MISFREGETPPADVIAELYRSAPLIRPVDDVPRIAAMYQTATVVVTAWDGGRLAGILRGWTDGAFDGYVCDLAVHPDYQRLGVGRELLERVIRRSPQIQWVLRASQIAREYYEHLGWQKIENGWFWPRSN